MKGRLGVSDPLKIEEKRRYGISDKIQLCASESYSVILVVNFACHEQRFAVSSGGISIPSCFFQENRLFRVL